MIEWVYGISPGLMMLGWNPILVWMIVMCNLVIVASYIMIPLMILKMAWSHNAKEIHFLWLLFAGFIVSCGLGHLMSIVVIWVPFYATYVGVSMVTAIISLLASIMLWKYRDKIRICVQNGPITGNRSDKDKKK